MKKIRKRTAYATAMILAAALLCGWLVYRGFDALAGAVSGKGIVGIRSRDVIWEVDGRKYAVRSYRSLGDEKIVILAGAPSSASTQENCNLLVSKDRIARFNDSGRLFLATPLLAIAGDTVREPYPLDEEMKGWGTKYRISRAKDDFCFEVAPAPPHHPRRIRFRIPAKYLENP